MNLFEAERLCRGMWVSMAVDFMAVHRDELGGAPQDTKVWTLTLNHYAVVCGIIAMA